MNVLPLEHPRIFGIESELAVHPYIASGEQSLFVQHQVDRSVGPDIKAAAASGFLSNGMRIYTDQNKNLEVATAEAATIDDALAGHFAGEIIAEKIAQKGFSYQDADGTWIFPHAYKRTMDTALTSHGEHENYFVGNSFSVPESAGKLVTHLTTRIIFTGPGMVCLEPDQGTLKYVIDQRCWATASNYQTSATNERSKPFIKSGGRNYTDLGARLQIVSGSMNMFALAVGTRLGSTSLVARLIECGKYPDGLEIDDAFVFMRTVAADLDLKATVKVVNGKRLSATEIQRQLAETAYQELIEPGKVPEDEQRWGKIWLDQAVDFDEDRINHWERAVEWIAKRTLLDRHVERKPEDKRTAEAAAFDVQWHCLKKGGMAQKLRAKGWDAFRPDTDEIEKRRIAAPETTRACIRGRHIREFGSDIHSCTWPSWKHGFKAFVRDNPFDTRPVS